MKMKCKSEESEVKWIVSQEEIKVVMLDRFESEEKASGKLHIFVSTSKFLNIYFTFAIP